MSKKFENWLFDAPVFLSAVALLIVVGGLVFGGCLVPIFGISCATEYAYCEQMQSMNTDMDFHWGFWTGCRVYVNGYWVGAHDVDYILLNGMPAE